MYVRPSLSRGKHYLSRRPSFLRFSLSSFGVGIVLFSLAALLLSACSLLPSSPVQSGTPVPGTADSNVTPSFDITPTPTQSITSGTTNITLQVVGSCPSALNSKWDSIIGTKSGVDKVQKVTCAPIENGAMAALVDVRYYAAGSRLDFYVYDNLSGTPARRFNVQNLIGGQASISPTNTIITAENPTNDPLGPNLFKEYSWNGNGYGQILFPGIFPYMTHYQAEQEQAIVNAQALQVTATPTTKFSVWQDSAYAVVGKMAQDIFHWSSNNVQSTTIAFNNSQQLYTIQATNVGPGGGGFIASLFRLDNVATNILEVKSVTSLDGSASLSSPNGGNHLGSPFHASGSYNSSGTILGRVAVYDDTYLTVGDTGGIHGSASTGSVSFSPTVSFHLSTKGLQEGLVVFYVTNQNNIVLSNQVIVAKVFLSA
jgi:hypothetical protein